MSNILSVFNPPQQRDLDESETLDCLPCQVMNSMLALGFGSYLVSGRAFKYSTKDTKAGISLKQFEKSNPLWWKSSVKGFGAGLIVYGIVRGTEGWVWNKEKKYQPLS
ncbi:hypothetical protein NCAS_0A14040 [Naumovozyma castellii]|uniref:DUF4536 domain-containing protein n=1 Tax=Naumovozyma castellii TaxID=27288 RepID=G0V913_NAUCA|nr:hypothetical protein NCAS_0A14040 [Naumovozyma castellii CBS 4309]CCC67962.1 hypothetical protein NCAS_0A14040 [Naumovozyma castellii CBS 4309]